MTAAYPHDSEVTDIALAARDGDRAALEEFIRATQRDVWRFVAHLAGTAAADDLAQETYLRAVRSLSGFRGRSSARTWLLAIARRVVIDQFRRDSVRPSRAGVEDWQLAAEHAQPTGLPGVDEAVALGDVLARIDDDRREAFVLTQMLRLTYPEAAEVCGCPVGTIRSRVARAREDLVGMLNDERRDSGACSAG